jgi:uncharacterized protein
MSAPIENPNQVRTWNILCHLSVLLGLIVPFGNLLGPFLVWQIKKNEFPSVIMHGKAALNFQITFCIFCVILGFVMAILVPVLHIAFLALPVFIIWSLCDLIFPIIAGLKAKNDEAYKYPFSFELIK